MAKNLTLIKLYAPWCGPCKTLGPIVEEVADETAVELKSIDIDADANAKFEYNIMGIPTLILKDGDQELERKSGMISKSDLITWINNHNNS